MLTIVRRTKGDDENRKVSTYRAKSRDYFLEGIILQDEPEVEYQAAEQWVVSWHEVFITGDGGYDLDVFPEARANGVY